MLTAREAYAQAIANSSDSANRRMRMAIIRMAIIAKRVQIADDGEKPDAIVGSDWPSAVIGMRRATCAECGLHVGLSSDSGAPASDLYPDVPVLCFECATK